MYLYICVFVRITHTHSLSLSHTHTHTYTHTHTHKPIYIPIYTDIGSESKEHIARSDVPMGCREMQRTPPLFGIWGLGFKSRVWGLGLEFGLVLGFRV